MRNILIVIALFTSAQLFAQSPDSLFHGARLMAEEKNYREAVEVMEALHRDYPENNDYSIYLARLYFWSEQPEKAKKVLLVIEKVAANQEALDLLIQVEIQLKNTETGLRLIEAGLVNFPESKNRYLLWKALALEQAGSDEEALKAISEIPENSAEYDAAIYLKTQILRKKKNAISTGHLLILSDDPAFSTQYLSFLEYTRQFKKHMQVFRLNYADMFNTHRLQFETDAYVKTTKRDYLYLNAGIAEQHSVFPFLRFGAEYYSERKKVTFSGGGRFLHFNSSNNTVLLTGHVAFLHNRWAYNYRPFVLLLPDQTLTSHVVYIRKTFEKKESHVQLDMQYGSLPYFFYTADILSRLSAYRIGLSAKFRVKDHWFIQPSVLYEYEEFVPDTYRNRYAVQLILSKRF